MTKLLLILLITNIYASTLAGYSCDGVGEIKYVNALYTGECKNNKRDGRGRVVFDDGAKYEGDWKADKKEGKGKYTYASGAIYDGYWSNNKKNGIGKYTDLSGNVYVGSWSDNKKNGHGVLTYSSGDIYDGEFKNDKRDGQGILTYASRDIYDGGWRDDKKNGKAKEISQYGTCEGKWEDGELVSISNEYTYDEAYSYFNYIRKNAGMIELRVNPLLQNAAQSHSDYIGLHNSTMNGMDFHHEKKGNEGFKGEDKTDRTIAAGYFSTLIGEGISNYCNAGESINSLMSAIYHRFGILDFTKNEVGIGFTQAPDVLERNFVHNTANSKLNILCQNDSYWFGNYFSKVCANEKLKINIDPYNEAKNEVMERNPKYVIWPIDGSSDNLYYFKDEVPDPMPGFKETGNPISIQFNPFYFPEDVVVYSFKLYKGDEEIKETRLLTKQTDPNQKFTKNQYALFPIKPLDRDTEYKVVIKYKYNGCSKQINTSFRTMK